MLPAHDASSPDVLVVGSGATGLATAWRLARAGLTVAVVDSTVVCGAATAASGAMLGVYGEITSATDRELTLRRAGRRYFDDWAADLAVEPAPGTFIVAGARRATDLARLESIETLARLDTAVERVSPADVPDIHPSPNWPLGGALYLAEEASIDAGALDAAARTRLRDLGVTFVDAEVDRVLSDGPTTQRVATLSGVELQASAVVLCTGARTTEILQRSGLGTQAPHVWPAKGTSLHLSGLARDKASPPPCTVRTPNRAFACGLHLVQRDGFTYLGATNRAARDIKSLGGASVHEVLTLLSTATAELDVGLERRDVLRINVGFRPLSGTGRPVVAEVADGLFVATADTATVSCSLPSLQRASTVSCIARARPRSWRRSKPN